MKSFLCVFLEKQFKTIDRWLHCGHFGTILILLNVLQGLRAAYIALHVD